MEQWEKNYYISAIAGANNGSSLVVMSKGMYQYDYCFYHHIILMALISDYFTRVCT